MSDCWNEGVGNILEMTSELLDEEFGRPSGYAPVLVSRTRKDFCRLSVTRETKWLIYEVVDAGAISAINKRVTCAG
jgi:hypothetical protein